MEKQSITIKVSATGISYNELHDERTFVVQGTRGEVCKKLDEICDDIDASFEQ